MEMGSRHCDRPMGLTNYHLKLIAAITMLIDHIGVVFYPDVAWLRVIGRVSFPLFIWLLVQGEAHTRDIWRYGLRLGLLGLISQPVYELTFSVSTLNILFQLLVGLVCLRTARHWHWLEPGIWLAGAALTQFLDISYGAYGMVLMLLVRYFQPTAVWWLLWVAFHLAWAWLQGPFQLPVMAVPLLFFCANGERGDRARWFYAFYPGHLALLSLIRWGLTSGW